MIASDGGAVVRLVAGQSGVLVCTPCTQGKGRTSEQIVLLPALVPLQQRVRAGPQGRGAVERMWPSEGRPPCRWGGVDVAGGSAYAV